MTKTVDIQQAQAHFPELLLLAQQGNEVIITEDDKPLAKLVPVTAGPQSRVAGLNAGQIWISDDFDAPLPEEFWTDIQ